VWERQGEFLSQNCFKMRVKDEGSKKLPGDLRSTSSSQRTSKKRLILGDRRSPGGPEQNGPMVFAFGPVMDALCLCVGPPIGNFVINLRWPPGEVSKSCAFTRLDSQKNSEVEMSFFTCWVKEKHPWTLPLGFFHFHYLGPRNFRLPAGISGISRQAKMSR